MHDPFKDRWSAEESPPWGWIIGSCKGDLIGTIETKELADYVVKLHNDEIDRMWSDAKAED